MKILAEEHGKTFPKAYYKKAYILSALSRYEEAMYDFYNHFFLSRFYHLEIRWIISCLILMSKKKILQVILYIWQGY